MAGWRRAVDLAMTAEEIETLTALSRSRTEAARHVERARMLLAYRQQRSFFAVGQRLGVHHQTVQRCVERALAYGALAALDDRPRPGKEPMITPEAKAWLVSLACDKPLAGSQNVCSPKSPCRDRSSSASLRQWPLYRWRTRLLWVAQRNGRRCRLCKFDSGSYKNSRAKGANAKLFGRKIHQVKPLLVCGIVPNHRNHWNAPCERERMAGVDVSNVDRLRHSPVFMPLCHL